MEIQRGPRKSTQVADKNDKGFKYQVILDTNSWVEEFSNIEGLINRNFQNECWTYNGQTKWRPL
eukprot:12861249-Ditylum_brightwellii.AAC.1